MEWPADLEETLQGILVSKEFDELVEKPKTAGRGGGGGGWTYDENKAFEEALAQIHEPGSPAFFENVASRIPRKSIQEIQNHYQALINDLKMIENGQFPFPNDVYNKAAVNVDQQQQQQERKRDDQEMDDQQAKKHGQLVGHGSASASDSSPNEAKITLIRTGQQRRRGVPWTEEEHQLFLMGLNKYGKGDWRSISRYYVITKTPTQVASHAQKYFRRQTSSTPIERRRPSIHDIQNVNPMITASSKMNYNYNVPQTQTNVDNGFHINYEAAIPFASSSCGLIMNSMLHDNFSSGAGIVVDQNRLFLPFNSTFPSDMDLIVDQASAGYPESSCFIPWETDQQYNGWTTDHSINYYNN